MKKLEQIQTNKLISNYGGVGSIIETNSNGSLLILPYNEWRCFTNMNHNNEQINDTRLLRYVQEHGYPHIARLVPMPNLDLSDKIYNAGDSDLRTTVSSKYFPEWFFCPHCRKLYKLSEWESFWKNTFSSDNKFKKNSPACPYCSSTIGKDKIRRYPLQQIRFVMASLETGDIQDVAFDFLWATIPSDGIWPAAPIQKRARNLTYRTRKDGDGLNAIYIENTDTNQRIYLSEIARNFIIKNNRAYKMVVRGSLSLYFPDIIRSLYIPIDNDDVFNAQNVEELDLHEFRYLTNDEVFKNEMIVANNSDLIVIRKPDLKTHFISRISAIERLKETSVLLSYTRMGKNGELHDWYNVEKQQIEPLIAKSKRPFENEPTFMPAVEAYGEGLFIEVDYKDFDNISDYKIFIHTFCHIIMKEMEFQCGYPLTSLKEKIYVDVDNQKGGLLIYTIAGSEGSYGGLISLTNKNKIIELIERGAERARYCPNDPICGNEQEAAHCFACLDIPETSCITFNNGLDRKTFLKYWLKKCNQEITSGSTMVKTNNDNMNLNQRPSGIVL